MESKVVVLNVKRYSFPDKETGEIREGSNIYYINGLIAVAPEQNSVGEPIVKMSAPYEAFNDFKEVPAVYDLDLDMRVNGKGQPYFVYNSSKYVGEIPLLKK